MSPLQSSLAAFGATRGAMQRAANTTFTATTIAAGGTIGVYTTTPVQLVASTAYDAHLIRVWNISACSNSAARGDVVFDLMIGGSGAETSIATFVFGAYNPYSSYTLPIFIPAGSRISGRVAAGVASRSLTWAFDYWNRGDTDSGGLPRRWIPYGLTVSSGSGAYGTALTPGNSNAWGSWTAIVSAATTYNHELWLPMIGVRTATVITAQNYRTQYAIGTTAEAATMLTNTTGVLEGPVLTGSTTEQLGSTFTATNPVHRGVEDIIFARRAAGASVSARGMASGTADANALGVAVLAAVK